VDFVVVDQLERERYGSGIDERFNAALPVAFRTATLTVYRAR